MKKAKSLEIESKEMAEEISPYKMAKKNSSCPKKPLSAYIFFSQEQRDITKMAHDQWSSSEIMKHVS